MIVRAVKLKDPNCLVNISSIIHSHSVQIQTTKKDLIFSTLREVYNFAGLQFQASEFIRNGLTIISLQLNDL